MTGDSHNYVFGRVMNPHKLNLGAGGSSGGEGALVALKGSPVGEFIRHSFSVLL